MQQATRRSNPTTSAGKDLDRFFGGAAENDALEAVAESPQTEIVRMDAEGDPDALVALLERKAELAPRLAAAVNKIIASQTFAEDWKEFGDGKDAKMCLTSAGAERVGRHFPIQFYNVTSKREDWTDGNGKAYSYVFEGNAIMSGHVVYARGAYSTRDAFLGKANGQWRALEEINPSHIANAAYHMFCGNAIKALLGLRGMPKAEWEKLMTSANRDASKASAVTHGRGTQGGTTQTDGDKQRELTEICMAIANAGKVIVSGDGYKTFDFEDVSEIADLVEVAQANCVTVSGFHGDRGPVKGKLANGLKGGWLNNALKKARELRDRLEAEPS